MAKILRLPVGDVTFCAFHSPNVLFPGRVNSGDPTEFLKKDYDLCLVKGSDPGHYGLRRSALPPQTPRKKKPMSETPLNPPDDPTRSVTESRRADSAWETWREHGLWWARRPLNVLPTQEELDAGVVTILWARTPQELSEALTRQARIRNSLAPLTP